MSQGQRGGPAGRVLPSPLKTLLVPCLGYTMAILLDEAERHYQTIDEARRLDRVGSQIELVRTRELLVRFLGSEPCRVLDVGGGAGVHSFWLAERGYQVTLVDAVAKHIELAKGENSRRKAKLVEARVGDARSLVEQDETFDAVLLFGPLYHLTNRVDRQVALQEALRVLRPGGVLLAVAISRFASTVNFLLSGELDDDVFAEIARCDRRTGDHRNPTSDPSYFTTSYWHGPQELREELESCGFEVTRLVAVEGPARVMRAYESNWTDSSCREKLLEAVRDLEEEPSLLGMSVHILAVASK